MFETYGVLIPALFGIFVALSVKAIKRKLHLLLIISTVLAIAVSLPFGVIYFGPSIWIHQELKHLHTTFSKDGIGIQTTGFTCGPAAAVTVLRQLGIEAQESDLAICSKCTPQNGTTTELLAGAIKKLYGKQGIDCSIIHFDSIDHLKESCPAIAVIKLSSAVSHYTVVLEVTDDKVILGDPIAGKKEWSYEVFRKKWWSVGIVVKHIPNHESAVAVR
jgi:predicted double-glycine peptidase